MSKVMQLINFLKAQSSLRHRQLRQFLKEENAEFTDLLTHNDVRWLSKGKALQRFWALLEHVQEFLRQVDSTNARKHLEFITSEQALSRIAFLTDLFQHLNMLNLKLQGEKCTAVDLWKQVRSFKLKLQLFITDIKSNMLHFPCLKSFCEANAVAGDSLNEFEDFLNLVIGEFNRRFEQFHNITHVLKLIENVKESAMSPELEAELKLVFPQISIPSLQLELCDVAVEAHEIEFPADKFPALTALALPVLTIFPSTYICESIFSKMNFIKNEKRTCLTDEHLNDLIRVVSADAITDNQYETVMAAKRVFHSSH